MNCRITTVCLLSIVAYRDVTCTSFDDWHFRGPNIALHKRAHQEPGTFVERGSAFGYTADLAVDGNENSDFINGSCTHTTGSSASDTHQHAAQWSVDLGGNFYVTGIIIVNRRIVRYRLQRFLAFGFNFLCPQNGCLLYNDIDHDKYKDDRIEIQIDTHQSYSKIAIKLPKYNQRQDGGLTYLTLCEVKIYAAPRPSCGVIGQLQNGNIDIFNKTGRAMNGQYTAGTVLLSSCREGFLMTGSSHITCLSDGSFDEMIPICEALSASVACTYMKITNGYMNPNRSLFTVHSKAVIVCNEGFHPISQEVTCLNTGYWNKYPNCTIVQCVHPGKIENGHYTIGTADNIYSQFSSLLLGRNITAKCDPGYESKGNDVRHCQSNQTWSGNQPKCKKKQCPYPGNIVNGVYRFENGSVYWAGSSLYNTTIYVKCNTGYNLKGSKELSCDANKTWGRKPYCQKVTCAFPENPNNGWYATKDKNGTFILYRSGQSVYQETINVICPEGNVLNSTSNVRQCLATKEWSGTPGQCVLVTCKRLKKLKGIFYNYTNIALPGGFPYNTVVTAYCNETFQLSNPQRRSRRCTKEGIWDNGPNSCISVLTETNAEQNSNAAVIGGVSGAVVVLISVPVVVLLVFCRKQRRQQEEREQNLYTDLSSERRNAETEYTDILELQNPNNVSQTERASCH